MASPPSARTGFYSTDRCPAGLITDSERSCPELRESATKTLPRVRSEVRSRSRTKPSGRLSARERRATTECRTDVLPRAD